MKTKSEQQLSEYHDNETRTAYNNTHRTKQLKTTYLFTVFNLSFSHVLYVQGKPDNLPLRHSGKHQHKSVLYSKHPVVIHIHIIFI